MPIDAAAEIAHSSELCMPRPAWAPTAGVQQDAGARVPGLLLAADHQVTPARGGAPVDPAYVVALPVLPDQHVVLTDHADPVRPGLTGIARRRRWCGSRAAAPPAG